MMARLLSAMAPHLLLLLWLLLLSSFLLATAFSVASSSSSHTLSAATTTTSHNIRLLPDGSANEVLYNILQNQQQLNNNNDISTATPQILVEGFISKRRAIGKHLIFLDIVPVDKVPTIKTLEKKKNNSSNNTDHGLLLSEAEPVQAIMRRDLWNNIYNNDADNTSSSPPSIPSFDVYHKIIQPGIYCRIKGQVGPSRNQKEAFLLCHSITLKLVNNNPQHLRNVLKFVHDGLLNGQEVLMAIPTVSHLDQLTPSPNQTCADLAVEILQQFPNKFLLNPSQLMGSTNSAKVQLLPPVPRLFVTPPPWVVSSWIDGDVEKEVMDGDNEVYAISQALQNFNSGNSSLSSSLRNKHQRPITLTGWVQNRRRYQDSVSIFEVVDDFSSLSSSSIHTGNDIDDDDNNDSRNIEMGTKFKRNDSWKQRIYAVLHPSVLVTTHTSLKNHSSIKTAEIYGNILSSGARATMHGFMAISSEDDTSDDSNVVSTATFWVTKCFLSRSSSRPSDIRLLLDLVHERKFDVDEAARALKLPYSQADELSKGMSSMSERQWLAAEITQSLQDENSRVGKISSSMIQSLATFAYARDLFPIQHYDTSSRSNGDDDEIQNVASSILESRDRNSLLTRPRWQQKKRPQLEFMIEQIASVLRSHPDYGKRKLNVVDIGGGKGLLSNLLAETFGEDFVDVQVIDISRTATNNGMMKAKRLGLENIRFDAMDATKVDVQSNKDVVVALHACGALSDVALGHAVSQGAGFVICPCCFRSNPHLRVPYLNDDKAVQLVTAEEFLGVDTDLYSSLGQLAELQGDIKLASKAMHTINALRAAAVDRLWRSKRGSQEKIKTSIKTFPIGFSTRNFCLVGKYDKST